MPLSIGDITLFMGPKEVGGPDDLEAAIIDFIDGARNYLFIAVQEIDNENIAKAIVRAKNRNAVSLRGKVRVQVVLEQSYLRSGSTTKDAFTSKGKHEENRVIHDAMLRTDIDVKADYNPNIFHQKFIIRDNSAVLTGSTNFTNTGVTANLNHIAIIHSRKIANVYKKEFSEIKDGRFGRNSMDRDERPIEVNVSGVRIKPLFAPDHGPELEIVKQTLKASSRIDFAVFTFSHSSGIDDALISARQRGLNVRGILDRSQGNQKWAATKQLKEGGVNISMAGKTGKLGKVHHKIMVVDERLIILGSFNYTGPANLTNDENILVIGDLDDKSIAVTSREKRLAKYVLDELDRIDSSWARSI